MLRKLRIYGFFYLHLPLSVLISALFTRMYPWDALSGPAGDKLLWSGLLLTLAAQHVLVSVGANSKRALSRAAAALLLVALALADRCFDVDEPRTDNDLGAPPSSPPLPAAPPTPPQQNLFAEFRWSLCDPALSSMVLCVALLLDVICDAFLGFEQVERAAAAAAGGGGMPDDGSCQSCCSLETRLESRCATATRGADGIDDSIGDNDGPAEIACAAGEPAASA